MVEQWRRLAVNVTLASPLALAGRKPAGQLASALDYLPGARLRGALAEVLLADGDCPPDHRAAHAHCGSATCAVGRLFVSPNAALFHDGLPGEATSLLPATAMSCAAAPGFLAQPTADASHGVFDTLIDRTCWEIMAPAGLLYRPRCPAQDCGANVERYRAAYGRRAVGGRLAYFANRLPTRLLARTAVDRRWGGAADDAGYSVPVVSEAAPDPADPSGSVRATVFSSEVLVPDGPDAELVAQALARIEHLGGGTSRGLGAVQVQVSHAPPPEPLAARIERFARALAVRRAQYARLAPLSAASLEGAFFSVDLRSDALLRRRGWEPTPVLDADLLRAATGVDDASLALVRANAEPGWRGGWHAAWGLPTPSELVACRGSSYLFRTNNLAAWTDALEALELAGIGERTTEGFGQVVVCDPFHLVLREQAV